MPRWVRRPGRRYRRRGLPLLQELGSPRIEDLPSVNRFDGGHRRLLACLSTARTSRSIAVRSPADEPSGAAAPGRAGHAVDGTETRKCVFVLPLPLLLLLPLPPCVDAGAGAGAQVAVLAGCRCPRGP